MQIEQAVSVDVCVCTFRRPSLRETLHSLAAQEGAAPFRVIVADNDETPSARALVDEARRTLKLNIVYLHAPARNISIARNACLEALEAPLAAFIDDDELAPPDWLARLMAGLGSADVVFGPVRAAYPDTAPRWARAGDFHSFGPAFRANGAIDTGYSSNVLMRRATIGSLRFEPALGRAGGEDTFFFSALHRRGAKLAYCAAAPVTEPTAADRLNLRWLLRRSFRAGQTHARVLSAHGRNRLAIAGPAAAKALYCGAAALACVWSPLGWRRNLVRGALHVGVVAKALGARDLVLYGAG